MKVQRFDVGSLRKPERTPEGWLRVDAYLTRTGVLEYLNQDGKTWRRELRLDSEVFSPESLKTYEGVPLTNEHPVEDGKRVFLNPKNTHKFHRGHVVSIRREGAKLAASLLVTHEEAIKALEGGKAQISVGYDASLDPTPGEHEGEHFDGIQRGIVANHVALVFRGRAGPEVRVRLDEADTAMVFVEADSVSAPETPPVLERKRPMRKMKFDSAELEVAEEVASAVEAERAAHATAVAEVKAELTKFTARADAADEQVAKLKAELAEAPAKLKAAAEARAALELSARRLAGEDAKFDGLSDLDVQVKALEAVGAKLKSKDPVYLSARFDAALEQLEEDSTEPAHGTFRRADASEGDEDRSAKMLAELAKRSQITK
jgi:hypothetical protein